MFFREEPSGEREKMGGRGADLNRSDRCDEELAHSIPRRGAGKGEGVGAGCGALVS